MPDNSAIAVWDKCLGHIKANLGEQAFNTWFKPIVPLSLDNKLLTLQVPSQFFYEMLEEKFIDVLGSAIIREIGPGANLNYSVVVDKGTDQQLPLTINLPGGTDGKNNKGPGAGTPFRSPFSTAYNPVDFLHESQLNPNYTFDTYIEGDCNRLGRSAGIAVARNPGKTAFNPLMIYGGVGLGKTHLVNAIGNKVKENNPDKFVLYVSTEKFTNQFMDAVQNDSIQDFNSFYNTVDVLIIDDVHSLKGREKTQEIFFNIFNHLHQRQRQIILTSDRPPSEMQGFTERLLGRFKWGLTADLQQPDFETRMAIIQKKMMADGIDIPNDVIEYLAMTVDTNIRELEGVLISLIAEVSLNNRDYDLQLAKQIIQNIVKEIDTEVNIDYIQKSVSEFYSVSVDQLKGKTRKKEIVMARQVAMYFAKLYTTNTLKSIGDSFGGRDHSTVIHALQSVEDLLGSNNDFKHDITELQRKLKVSAV